MPIQMDPAANYLADIALGKVVRYGAILKDVGTGQIVGHLKETGAMQSILSNLAMSPLKFATDPLAAITNVIGTGINAYQIHGVQTSVNQVKSLVEGLQLMTNVAAFSSIAGLGVSIAGFALVNSRLKGIDSKIDGIANQIDSIKNLLSDLSIEWSAMSNARFQTAAETLITAEKANTESRRLELSKEAASEFALLRNFYSHLLRKKGLLEDISLGIEHLEEIISRYTVSCVGVLQAEFMTGDLGSYRTRLETILSEYADLVSFSPKALYLARCDAAGPLNLELQHQALSSSLVELSQKSKESVARIESYKVELEYITKNRLSVQEYLSELRSHDTDIVLLRS